MGVEILAAAISLTACSQVGDDSVLLTKPRAVFGTMHLRQNSAVSCLAFSRDGSLIASGGDDTPGTTDFAVTLFSVKTGKILRRLVGHRHPVTSVVIRNNGERVYSSALDGTFRSWDALKGKEINSLTINGLEQLSGMDVAPDEKMMVVAGNGPDNSFLVAWDLKQNQETYRLKLNSNIGAAKFSRSGRLVGCVVSDGTIYLLEAKTGRVLFRFEAKNSKTIAFSSDDRYVAAGSDYTSPDTKRQVKVSVWDLASGRLIRSFTSPQGSLYMGVAGFTRNGKQLLTMDGDIQLWDTGSGKLLHQFKAEECQSIAQVSPSGTYLATGSQHRTVVLWDLKTRKRLFDPYGHHASVSSIDYSSDAKLIASGDRRGVILIWDAKTRRILKRFKAGQTWVTHLQFSANCKQLLSVTFDGSAVIWDLSTGKRELTRQVHFACFLDDNVAVFVKKTENGLKVTGTKSFERQVNIHTKVKRLRCLALSPDGVLLAIGDNSTHTEVWSTKTGRIVSRLRTAPSSVRALEFSQDGNVLAEVTRGELRIWRLRHSALAQNLRPEKVVKSIRFSPRGHLVAAAEGFAVSLWEVTTGQRLHYLSASKAHVEAIAFSPDARLLLTAGEDYVLRAWDLTHQPGKRNPALANGQIAASWQHLSDSDARKANRAVWALASRPSQTIEHIKKQLNDVPNLKKLKKLIAD